MPTEREDCCGRCANFVRLMKPNAETETALRENEAAARIAEIDAMFEGATGWGSWMVEAANEREAMANRYGLEHKYQARTASGGRTD